MNSYFLILSLILIILFLSIDLGLNVDYGKYIAIGISVICLVYSVYSLRKRDKMVVPEGGYEDISNLDLIKSNIDFVKGQMANTNKNSEEYNKLLIQLKMYEDKLKQTKKSWWQSAKNKFKDSHLYGQFTDEGRIYGNF